MSKLGWALVLALVAAAGGFIAGRASGGVDDQQLRDELAEYRGSLKRLAASWTDLWKSFAARGDTIAAADRRGSIARSQAARHMASADSAKATADQLEGDLATSKDRTDSLRNAIGALAARGTECRQCRAANDSLTRAASEDSTTKASLAGQVADLRKGHENDSTAIANGVSLIGKLERAARGCRIPLLDLPCPMPIGTYSLDDQAFRAGGAVPVKLGPLGRVMISVTTRVGGGRP